MSVTELRPDGAHDAAGGATAESPIREVLALPGYRRFWLAQFLAALVNGTIRFTFIWLVTTELTAWAPAAGILGLAVGLPAMMLSVPAGVWSDRVDRRLLVIRLSLVASVLLGITAVTVQAEMINVALAAVFAFGIASALASASPALQAMVPSLVPRERLMSGVALQNIGMQLAMFLGFVIGGAAIAAFGSAGAFLLLAVMEAVSAWSMSRVALPARVAAGPRRTMKADALDGLAFALRREPMRSLMAISLLMGLAIGAWMVNLPEFGDQILQVGPFATGVLAGTVGLGMVGTSLVLASKANLPRLGVLLGVAIGTGLGPGLLLLGASRSYALSLLVMVLWGTGGGVAIASHRTLLQLHTPDEMMGRVMGTSALLLTGAFPLGALLTAVTAGALGPDGVMMLVGGAITVMAIPLTARRAIRDA